MTDYFFIEGLSKRLSIIFADCNITYVSKYIGVDRRAVYDWFHLERIQTKYVIKLCKLFDISADYLLLGVGDPPAKNDLLKDIESKSKQRNRMCRRVLEEYDAM